jgi:hypothetical protein
MHMETVSKIGEKKLLTQKVKYTFLQLLVKNPSNMPVVLK